MAGPRKIKKPKKKTAKKRPQVPLIGTAPGQVGRMHIGDSVLHVTRGSDRVILGKMPKKQRFIVRR